MKPTLRLLLIGSLLANAALVTLHLCCGRGAPTPLSPAPTSLSATHSSIPVTDFATTLDPRLWPALAADDLPSLAARLRATGFPPYLIRAILNAQLTAHFDARRLAIEAPKPNIPYWKVSWAKPDPARTEALNALNRERTALMKQLLGPDYPGAVPAVLANLERSFESIVPGKSAQLTRLQLDYDALRYNLDRTGSQQEQNARQALLDKEQRADFAKILTPAELTEYDFRTSTITQQLREQLGAFNPSEDEFRTLYALRKSFEQQAPNVGPDTFQTRAMATAETALNAQIKAALGEARFADYTRSLDENYSKLTALVSRLDLPAPTAVQIYDLQKAAQVTAAALQADPTLTAEARAAQIAALAKKTTADLSAALGSRGFEAYRQNAGSWLQKITQPAPVAPGG